MQCPGDRRGRIPLDKSCRKVYNNIRLQKSFFVVENRCEKGILSEAENRSRPEGLLRDAVRDGDGDGDIILMSILEEEWDSLRETP